MSEAAELREQVGTITKQKEAVEQAMADLQAQVGMREGGGLGGGAQGLAKFRFHRPTSKPRAMYLVLFCFGTWLQATSVLSMMLIGVGQDTHR